MANKYYLGQGTLYAAERDSTGTPLGFMSLGNCSSLGISVGVSMLQHMEEIPAVSSPFALNLAGNDPQLDFVIEDLKKENLSIAFYGNTTAVTGATATNEVITARLGKMVPLSNINLSSITYLKNSALSVTYVNGTDYTIDLKTGSITFPSTGAITEGQSLKATYVYGASEGITAFTTNKPYYWVRFNGLDQDNKPCVADFYKVRLLPPDKVDLLSDSLSNLHFSAKVFFDESRPSSYVDPDYVDDDYVDMSSGSGVFNIRRA